MDPTSEEGWTRAYAEASARMAAVLEGIDHDRRAELIHRELCGRLAPGEGDELSALQRACDDAMAEVGGIKLRYQRWRARQPGGDELSRRSGATDGDEARRGPRRGRDGGEIHE